MQMKSVKAILRRLQNSRLSSSATHGYYPPSAGRWLWDEHRRRQEHTTKLNIEALEHAIAKAVGLKSHFSPVHVEKLADGVSNKVFRATVDRKGVIIKIPDPVVPSRLSTASEVATLEFLRSELELPVPQVLSWSDDCNNPVGCEYVIMEEASGQALNAVWGNLAVDAKVTVVDEIILMQKRLLVAASMFGGYGSLYFTDDVARLGLLQSLPVGARQASRFCLSTLVHRHFTDLDTAARNVYGGPCELQSVLMFAYTHALNRVSPRRLSSLYRTIIPGTSRELPKKRAIRRNDRAFAFPISTISDTSRLTQENMLKLLCMAIPYITPRATGQRLPLMWHGDLHLGNVFVSPEGKITSLVDWQDTKVLPLFLQAKVPSFIDLEPSMLLWELPDNFSDLPEPTRTDTWEKFRQSMLRQYYLADWKQEIPELAATLENGLQTPIRKQVELFAQISRAQDADALLLRETLLRIQRHWVPLVNDEHSVPSCPISIDGDGLVRHQQDGRRYNEFQDALKARDIPVADEGWVPADEFEQRKGDLSLAIEEIKLSLDEQRRREFQARLIQWNLTD